MSDHIVSLSEHSLQTKSQICVLQAKTHLDIGPIHRVSKNDYTVFQKNIKSTMSLIIILLTECLICALPAVKISFTCVYPLRCDMISLKIGE